MVSIEKAAMRDIRILSKRILTELNDKNGQIYQENVAKFGIPDEYVKKVFTEDALLEDAEAGKKNFYLALEKGRITGFIEINIQNSSLAEIDRLIIFPRHRRKGIGTELVNSALSDLRQKGIRRITASTGKEETPARRFYGKTVSNTQKKYHFKRRGAEDWIWSLILYFWDKNSKDQHDARINLPQTDIPPKFNCRSWTLLQRGCLFLVS